MKRRSKRLDYKVLDTTGKKVEKLQIRNENLEKGLSDLSGRVSISTMDEKVREMTERLKIELQVSQQTIGEDIDDFLDENPIEQASSEELEISISNIEKLRTTYKTAHNKLKIQLGEDYANLKDEYENRLIQIKQYIISAKKYKTDERRRKDISTKEKKVDFCRFLLNEASSAIQAMRKEISIDWKRCSDEEIFIRNKDFHSDYIKMESISKMVKELIESSYEDEELRTKIEEIKHNYYKLSQEREKYINNIKKEVQNRDLMKQELFKNSQINIQLPKFSGYDSKLDIYSFKSEFLKLYEKSTPKRIMPDLLKNNLLEGSALTLVKEVNDITDIWKRLIEAYGDTKLLLRKKLSSIDNVQNLYRCRDPEKLANAISSVINIMKDLSKLACDHNLESRLYSGDAIHRIYRLLGENRITRWINSTCEKDSDDKTIWNDLIEFLEKELKVQQRKVLIQGKFEENARYEDSSKEIKVVKKSNSGSYVTEGNTDEIKCSFCNQTDHVLTNGPRSTKIVQYFACKKFVDMTPADRFKELRLKGLCVQCLFPGASQESGKHADGRCQRDFTCQNKSHEKFTVKKHVLVCQEHCDAKQNKDLLHQYRSRFIDRQPNIPSYSKNIKLSFHLCSYPVKGSSTIEDDVEEKAIYILQTIEVGNVNYSLFYDTGCSEMVSRLKAIKSIGSRATKLSDGPINLAGVGNSQVVSKHGIYQVKLPLANGKDARLSGICIDNITNKFPIYPLKEVERDIKIHYEKSNGKVQLPTVPHSVGGETDFMIGAKYLRYHPEVIFQLPSGLTIYKSCFRNPDGSRGVIGGPHKVFSRIEESLHHHHNLKTFLSNQYQLYKDGLKVNLEIDVFHTRSMEMFQAAENAGSEITYRCQKCRNCKECQHHEGLEMVSLKEEVEQDFIEKSVTVDVKNKVTTASLPLLYDPAIKLSWNKEIALKVYQQQLRKLEKIPSDKLEILQSEAKLQRLGYVSYVADLTESQQKLLKESPIQNFIPWRVVWKPNSVSTPCRVVFDASQPTKSGYSLNSILAKGTNTLNKYSRSLYVGHPTKLLFTQTSRKCTTHCNW